LETFFLDFFAFLAATATTGPPTAVPAFVSAAVVVVVIAVAVVVVAAVGYATIELAEGNV